MSTDAVPDFVLPFEVKPLGIRGRIVRLGPVIDDILSRHDYPPPVSALLAQSVALTALLGSALKFDGKFILQTKTDGPVAMVVADYVAPNGVRGTARFDANNALAGLDEKALLGKGYLAMTVDQGADMDRYQGIVPLHFQMNVWAMKKNLSYSPRTDEYTFAWMFKPVGK